MKKTMLRLFLIGFAVTILCLEVFAYTPTPVAVFQPSDPNYPPPSPLMQGRIIKWQGEAVTGEIDVIDPNGSQPTLSGSGFTFSVIPAKTILVSADPNHLAKQFTFAAAYVPPPTLVGRVYTEVTSTNIAGLTYKRSLEILYVRKQPSPITGCRMN